MKTFAIVLGVALMLGVVAPAAAFDTESTFGKYSVVLSPEVGYGNQFNLETLHQGSDIEYWNAGVRFSLLPFGTTLPGLLHGALEVGLEPFYQRYVDPVDAFFGGLGAVLRYHVLSLGRFVPYVEMAGFAGGTDLKIVEIDSDFTFLVFGGVGASYFIGDRTAVYAGYRLEHVSNGNTSRPNRGFESHMAVLGMSFYIR